MYGLPNSVCSSEAGFHPSIRHYTVLVVVADRGAGPTAWWPLCTRSPNRRPLSVDSTSPCPTTPPTTAPSLPSPASSCAWPERSVGGNSTGKECEAQTSQSARAAVDGASNNSTLDAARRRRERLRPEDRPGMTGAERATARPATRQGVCYLPAYLVGDEKQRGRRRSVQHPAQQKIQHPALGGCSAYSGRCKPPPRTAERLSELITQILSMSVHASIV